MGSATAHRDRVVPESTIAPVEARDGVGHIAALGAADDLSREVYCVLGIPIDAVEMPAVLHSIEAAAGGPAPFVVSTPNLNFLITSRGDAEFRESLLQSDLCPADGMPIVWIARLLGIPIKHRIAGSDLFDALKARPARRRPLRVFLFGATEDVAVAAAKELEDRSSTLRCVGYACPGFGTVDELSAEHFIEGINASGADFLVAALGAAKGQRWLRRNHHRLRVPLRAHLGATINFQAGTVKRAPPVLRRLGFEWLWRIRQEPHLWLRYWRDGGALLRLMLTHVLPLAVSARTLRQAAARRQQGLQVAMVEDAEAQTLRFAGFAVAANTVAAAAALRDAFAARKSIIIDFSEVRGIDARFLGLLLMTRKQLLAQGRALRLVGLSDNMTKILRRHGLEYLLAGEGS